MTGMEKLQKEYDKAMALHEAKLNYFIKDHRDGTFTVVRKGYNGAISDHRSAMAAANKIDKLARQDVKNA